MMQMTEAMSSIAHTTQPSSHVQFWAGLRTRSEIKIGDDHDAEDRRTRSRRRARGPGPSTRTPERRHRSVPVRHLRRVTTIHLARIAEMARADLVFGDRLPISDLLAVFVRKNRGKIRRLVNTTRGQRNFNGSPRLVKIVNILGHEYPSDFSAEEGV